MPVFEFDHYTLRCSDVDVTAYFYESVLDMRSENLDEIGFPMRLLFLNDKAVIHLMGTGKELDDFLSRNAPCHINNRARDACNIEHVAFNATGIDHVIAKLNRFKIQFVERSLSQYGVVQLMFDDPEGVEIELNFPISERAQSVPVIL